MARVSDEWTWREVVGLTAALLVAPVILTPVLSGCAVGPRTYGSGEPSSRIDFFDARGNRTGYGDGKETDGKGT